MCPATLSAGQAAITTPAVVDISSASLVAEELFERLAAARGMDQQTDGISISSREPQPMVLSHDRNAGLIRVPVWCLSDHLLLSLVFGDESIPDSEEDIVDAFWCDWKLLLVPEAFLDAS